MIKSPYELPEFVTALERERVQRVIAFLDINDSINGFEVRPLTLRNYSLLRLMNSPFIPPFRTPSTVELAAFLWVLSPKFIPGESWRKKMFLRRFRHLNARPLRQRLIDSFRIRAERKLFNIRLEEAKTIKSARDFMEDALADRPEASGEQSPDYYSDECSGVSMIASVFPWTEDHILDLPLKRFFQYLNWISEQHYAAIGKPCLLSNPSDRVIEKYLGEVNSKN